MAFGKRTAAPDRREALRREFWPGEDPWTGDNDKGWFRAPRTLPLLLVLLSQKALSGKQDPTRVYLELFARHIDSGVIEMCHEGDHAFAAGYDGSRSVRTWQERMRMLERLGLIRTRRVGNQEFKFVLLVHPTTVIKKLRDDSKVPAHWWDAYRARQIETKEATHESRATARKLRKVVSIRSKVAAREAVATKA